jgi:hypothetical protein
MAGTWDADITIIHAADEGGSLATGTVRCGEAFDVLATIRVGRNLMQFVDTADLFVSVRNLSASRPLTRRHLSIPLAPQDAALSRQLRVAVAGGWAAEDGDLLEALATLKVTAGVNPDYALARSAPFIVTMP